MSDRLSDACEGLHKSKEIDQPMVDSLIVALWLGATRTCLIDRCAIKSRWTDGYEHG